MKACTRAMVATQCSQQTHHEARQPPLNGLIEVHGGRARKIGTRQTRAKSDFVAGLDRHASARSAITSSACFCHSILRSYVMVKYSSETVCRQASQRASASRPTRYSLSYFLHLPHTTPRATLGLYLRNLARSQDLLEHAHSLLGCQHLSMYPRFRKLKQGRNHGQARDNHGLWHYSMKAKEDTCAMGSASTVAAWSAASDDGMHPSYTCSVHS